MIVLDTTVLVYAVGDDHMYREPCRTLIEAIAGGEVLATTTVEVVQEFTYVRARRRGRADAASLGSDFVDLLSPLLVVEEQDLRAGLVVYTDCDGVGCFDAVLATAARSAGADAIVSADRAFSSVADIRHVVPDEAGVRQLLTA